ncbi:flavin reductase family protein [Micromonospora coerulea]|uniref:flavin reductase family protein n=1 Tax=Micromonospora coerulea TaxID=47856 RepID=UPI001907FFFF|nr:flavin reductase family protein [Micromonospora veneta]
MPEISASAAPLKPTLPHLRHTLGHFPTGVTVVTTIDDGKPVGVCANSFVSVSLEPPLVGVFLKNTSRTLSSLRRSGSLVINILADRQEHIARAFAAPDGDRFANVDWRVSSLSGAPVLDGVCAWLDCRTDRMIMYGDHYLMLGCVVDSGFNTDSMPLLFHRSRYVNISG